MKEKELYDLLHQVYRREIKPEYAYYKILKPNESKTVNRNEQIKKVCDNWMPDKGTSATRCINCGYDRWEHSL